MEYLSRRKVLSVLGNSTVSLTGCASGKYKFSDASPETVEGCVEKLRGVPCVEVDYELENPRIGEDIVFSTTVVDNPKSGTLHYFWDLGPRDYDYELEDPSGVKSYDERGRYVVNLVVSNRIYRDEERYSHLGYRPKAPAFRTSITVNVLPLKQSSLKIENEQVNIFLKGARQNVSVDDSAVLSFRAANLISNNDLNVWLILEIPTGLTISWTTFEQGIGQYPSTYTVSPGNTVGDRIRVEAEGTGTYTIAGQAVYYFDENGGSHSETSDISVNFKQSE